MKKEGEKMYKDEKGYSLVEVLVAMTVLVIAVMPMFGTYPKLMQSTQRSVETEEGGRLASTVAEYIKGKGYTSLSAILINASILPKDRNVSATSDPNSNIPNDCFVKTYELEKISPESNTYKCKTGGSYNDFNGTFGYNDTTVSPAIDFFLLNSKYGLNLGTAKIKVMMDWADVQLRETTKSSITTGIINSRFIIGKVEITGMKDLSGKAKSKEIKFVVTPIED